MDKITVVDWIGAGEADGKIVSIGGMGGWFNGGAIHGDPPKAEGHRWADYVDALKPELIPYAEAIRESVIELQLKITGEQHQYSESGVPLFSDGTIGSFSYRAWGDIMAAIWSDIDDKDYDYMKFYM